MAKSNLALLLHHLEGQDHVSSFILNLSVKLRFRVVPQNKQSRACESRDDQNQRRQQFRTEFQDAGLSGLRAPQSIVKERLRRKRTDSSPGI
jgi:hypothetical protein